MDHPILGWFSGRVSRELLDAMPVISAQLRGLWSRAQLKLLFASLWSVTAIEVSSLADPQKIS